MLALLNYLNEVLFIGKETPQLNGEIKDRELRVITASGEQLGIMSAKDALHEAEKRGQDLVKHRRSQMKLDLILLRSLLRQSHRLQR